MYIGLYAPVARMQAIRALQFIINKFDFEVRQLDVKRAFLNGILEKVIYMEIPEGLNCDEEVKKTKVRKLKYGLKIGPKLWNERFTEIGIELGLKSYDNEPCLFILEIAYSYIAR